MVFGGLASDAFAHFVALGDIEAHFQFEIEFFGWAECGRILVWRLHLPPWTADRGATGDDAAGAAVVADGEMTVVREEGRLVGPEHFANVAGVVDAAVEVDESRWRDGDLEVGFVEGDQGLVAELFVVAEGGVSGFEEFEDLLAELGEGFFVEFDEAIEERELLRIEKSSVREHEEVEGEIADGDDDARTSSLWGRESEGEILDREMRVGGGFDPALVGGRNDKRRHD